MKIEKKIVQVNDVHLLYYIDFLIVYDVCEFSVFNLFRIGDNNYAKVNASHLKPISNTKINE